MEENIFYILFNNHENGLRLYSLLKKAGLSSKISPTPRTLSKCCGISLIIEEEEIEQIEEIVKENNIDILGIESMKKDINPRRDTYC